MASNGVTNGDTIQWTAPADGAVSTGDAVGVGKVLGVAHEDIAVGETKTLEIVGVWNIPKGNVAIAQGALLNWDASADSLITGNANAAGDITGAAVAWKAAAAGDSHVAARLSPGSGT